MTTTKKTTTAATLSDAEDLVAKAQQQLDEHKEWLVRQLCQVREDVPAGGEMADSSGNLTEVGELVRQVYMIRLRLTQVSGKVVSVVYEYPDELYAFLSSDKTPKHLRDALAGGHVVDPGKPLTTVKREVE